MGLCGFSDGSEHGWLVSFWDLSMSVALAWWACLWSESGSFLEVFVVCVLGKQAGTLMAFN